MKRFICGVLIGGLITTAISITASGVWENIPVLRNDIRVIVNGNEITADNFLYEDTTYIPLRAVSSALGERVEYDEDENTAYIGERTDHIVSKYTPSDYVELVYITEQDGIYYICASDYIRVLKGDRYISENTNYYDILENENVPEFRVKDKSWELTYIDGVPYVPYDTYVEEIEPYL